MPQMARPENKLEGEKIGGGKETKKKERERKEKGGQKQARRKKDVKKSIHNRTGTRTRQGKTVADEE